MLKIWAKVLKKEKIIKSKVFEFDGEYNSGNFFDQLSSICFDMDIPTPVLLKKHQYNFERFKNTKFTKDDFVESFDFTALILENATSEQKNRPITVYTDNSNLFD